MGDAEIRSRRITLFRAAPFLLVLGLAARFGLSGWPADAAGGATYTALAYVLIALALPARPPVQIAWAAFAFSSAIELLQLTDLPRSMADAFSPSRLLFGTSFTAADFPPYAIGAILAAAADRITGARRDQPFTRAGRRAP